MRLVSALVFATGVAVSVSVSAQVQRITRGQFLPSAGDITFSEKPVGTVNPVYAPADYGGTPDGPTVMFDGFFIGQSFGGASPPCPDGAALSGCVIGLPSSPLRLSAASPDTVITTDVSSANSPVLSGSPKFNGPIAMIFSIDVAAVGLEGGYFDSPHSTSITAFRRDGSLLGSVTNIGVGIEFLGLSTTSGNDEIAGLLFSLAGAETAGFAIDNLRFGTSQQVRGGTRNVPTLSDAAVAAMALALLALAVFHLRRRTNRQP
jgi:hypothetical protein